MLKALGGFFLKSHAILFFLSFGIVAFGQPAWSPFLGLIASFSGYALFFYLLIQLPHAKHRFGLAAVWMAAVSVSSPGFSPILFSIFWRLLFPYTFGKHPVWSDVYLNH